MSMSKKDIKRIQERYGTGGKVLVMTTHIMGVANTAEEMIETAEREGWLLDKVSSGDNVVLLVFRRSEDL